MLPNEVEQAIVLTIMIGAGYILYNYHIHSDHIFVKTKDGDIYKVQKDYRDRKKAAELIAILVKKSQTLISHLQRIAPDDPRTTRLKSRFNPENIIEKHDGDNATSYTINKGDRLVLCIRQKTDKSELVDQNTAMFVMIHELAHIASESIGHNEEFYENNKWLLSYAIDIGVYQYVDYEENNETYCGMEITNQVYDLG